MSPFLDVSDVLLDPELADSFDVVRRSETVNGYGESVQAPSTISNVIGVVTLANPNDLDRLDDTQRMGRHLSVVTRFKLRGPAPGYQPDLIVWRGDSYIVKHLDPYPQFGAGFVQAIVGSIDIIDQPPADAGNWDNQQDERGQWQNSLGQIGDWST